MGGVDLKDQLLHMYMVERKKMSKWYLKLFKRLLNATVLSSFVVYRQVTGRVAALVDRSGPFPKGATAAEEGGATAGSRRCLTLDFFSFRSPRVVDGQARQADARHRAG